MDYLAILKRADSRQGQAADQRPAHVSGHEKNELYEERLQGEPWLAGQLLKPPRLPGNCVGTCRYDWQLGYRGRRLHCVAHPAHGGSTTVFRLAWGGYDTLAELLRLDMLTGEALTDARRPQ
jgi:hypothetical protein